VQVALGITTLLTYVPVPLGAAHQAGAMVLFTLMLSLLYSIKPAPSLGTFRWVAGWFGWASSCGLGGGAVDIWAVWLGDWGRGYQHVLPPSCFQCRQAG
jgi:hypothetical protein